MDVISRTERYVYLRVSVPRELLEAVSRHYPTEHQALASMRLEWQKFVQRLGEDSVRGRVL